MNITKVVASVAFAALASAGAARATTTILDPLHGWCSDVTSTTCLDLGANTPLAGSTFGFNISPGPQTGDLLLEFLIPNDQPLPASISVTGSNGGTDNTAAISTTATLVSATAWNSGGLDAYLGLNATPANGIGAYLPNAQALDPAATGFFVFQADIGDTTIAATAAAGPPIFDVTADIAALPIGSYIVAYCGAPSAGATIPTGSKACFGNDKNPVVATANSGALLVTGGLVPPEQIPEPSVLALLSLALLGMGLVTMRRRV